MFFYIITLYVHSGHTHSYYLLSAAFIWEFLVSKDCFVAVSMSSDCTFVWNDWTGKLLSVNFSIYCAVSEQIQHIMEVKELFNGLLEECGPLVTTDTIISVFSIQYYPVCWRTFNRLWCKVLMWALASSCVYLVSHIPWGKAMMTIIYLQQQLQRLLQAACVFHSLRAFVCPWVYVCVHAVTRLCASRLV